MLSKQQKRNRRHKKVRAKIKGTAKTPRLCIFRSNKYIYAQLINDEKGKTLVSVGDKKIEKPVQKAKPIETGSSKSKEVLAGKLLIAHQAGKLLAEKAVKAGITKIVFDRGGYKYHGRVKALAEGARKGGLKF